MKSDVPVYSPALAAYGLVLFTFVLVEDVLILGLWRPFDIASYYGLASFAVASIYAIADASPSASVLMFATGSLSGYAIFIVSLLMLASAVLVMEIGRQLYGNVAGFLAGLVFTLNIAWAQGYFTIGEALALVLTLLSAYALLFMGEKKYIVSGLILGVAACFKPLMILLLPASLVVIYRKGEPKGAIVSAGAMLLPLIGMAIAIFTVYGSNAWAMASNSGFELVGFLTDDGYRSPDALMAVADIAIAVCMLLSLLPLALLGFSRKHGLAEEYFLAAGLCLMATILLKQYLHYWLIALPFLALLCTSVFARRHARG